MTEGHYQQMQMASSLSEGWSLDSTQPALFVPNLHQGINRSHGTDRGCRHAVSYQ